MNKTNPYDGIEVLLVSCSNPNYVFKHKENTIEKLIKRHLEEVDNTLKNIQFRQWLRELVH